MPELSFACEFGEFVRLQNDITEGVENENGVVRLTDAPGSGGRLRADAHAQMAEAERVAASV